MGIDVRWANAEKTILHYTPQENWAWEDVDTVMAETYGLMDASEQPIYSIIDFTDKSLLPRNPLSQGKRLAGRLHANMALIIFVSDNNFFHAMFSVFKRIHPPLNELVRFANTVEMAHILIEEHMKNYR